VDGGKGWPTGEICWPLGNELLDAELDFDLVQHSLIGSRRYAAKAREVDILLNVNL
jgi:hypothetical protein